jgi:hypothetical protein
MAQKNKIKPFPSYNFSCQSIKNRNCFAFEEIILKLKMDNHLLEEGEDIDFLEQPIDYQHAHFRGDYSYSAMSSRKGYSHKVEFMHDLANTSFTEEQIQKSLNTQNSMNETLLHYLMRNNEWKLIKFIIKKYPHDIDYQTVDFSGNTLLHNFNHLTFDNLKGTVDEKKKFHQEKLAFLKHLVDKGVVLETTNHTSTMALAKILEKGGYEITQYITQLYEKDKRALPFAGLKSLVLHRRIKELNCWLKSSCFDLSHIDKLYNQKIMNSRELTKTILLLSDEQFRESLYEASPLCFASKELILASMICLKNYPNNGLFDLLIQSNEKAYEKLYFSSPSKTQVNGYSIYEVLNDNIVDFINKGFPTNEEHQEKYLSLIKKVLLYPIELNKIGKNKESIFSFVSHNIAKDKLRIAYATSIIEILTNHGALIEHNNAKGDSLYEIMSKKSKDSTFIDLLTNRQSYLEKNKLELMLEEHGKSETKKLKI